MHLFFVDFKHDCSNNEQIKRAGALNAKKSVRIFFADSMVGQGFLVRDRLIVCNNFCVPDGFVSVNFAGGIKSSAELVYRDEGEGLAILQAEVAPRIFALRHREIQTGDVLFSNFGWGSYYGIADIDLMEKFRNKDGTLGFKNNQWSGSLVMTPNGEIVGTLFAHQAENGHIWSCCSLKSINKLLHHFCGD